MTAVSAEHAERRPLPPGWRTVRLGDVGAIGAGITLGKLFLHEDTRLVPYLRVANVKDGYLDLADVNQLALPEWEIQKCLLRQGDLLLTEGGDPDKLGRGTVWGGQLPECVHQNHIFRVRFNPAQIEPKFVAFELQSPYGKAYFLKHAKQTTGIATINQRVLANFPLMLPPLAEQRAIVARIERDMAEVERLRAAAERQKGAIANLSVVLLGELFPGQDAWAQGRLKDVLFNIEAGKSLKCEERPATATEWGILKVSAVSWGAFRQDENKVLPDDVAPTIEYEVQQGDLLISRANTTELVGAVVLVDETRPRLLLSDKTLRLCVDEKLVFKPYLPLALRSSLARSFIEGKATGTSESMKNISQVVVKNIPLPLPSLATQQEIVQRFARAQPVFDRLQVMAERQRAAVDALPAALLREMFGQDGF
jgi:type I restriction enzyme S subunit